MSPERCAAEARLLNRKQNVFLKEHKRGRYCCSPWVSTHTHQVKARLLEAWLSAATAFLRCRSVYLTETFRCSHCFLSHRSPGTLLSPSQIIIPWHNGSKFSGCAWRRWFSWQRHRLSDSNRQHELSQWRKRGAATCRAAAARTAGGGDTRLLTASRAASHLVSAAEHTRTHSHTHTYTHIVRARHLLSAATVLTMSGFHCGRRQLENVAATRWPLVSKHLSLAFNWP